MKEELTEKMHSELTVTKAQEVKLRAGCVWNVLKKDATKEQIVEQAREYGITYEAAMKHRDYWLERYGKAAKVR